MRNQAQCQIFIGGGRDKQFAEQFDNYYIIIANYILNMFIINITQKYFDDLIFFAFYLLFIFFSKVLNDNLTDKYY